MGRPRNSWWDCVTERGYREFWPVSCDIEFLEALPINLSYTFAVGCIVYHIIYRMMFKIYNAPITLQKTMGALHRLYIQSSADLKKTIMDVCTTMVKTTRHS